MPQWVCGGEAGCGTKYAVCLFRCPRCHNTAFYVDGDPMAKITERGPSDKTLTTHGAATEQAPAEAPRRTEEAPMLRHCLDCTTAYAADLAACPHCRSERYSDQPVLAPAAVVGEHGPELLDLPEPTPATAEDREGGDGSSPGNSSSASTPKPETSSGPTPSSRPSRARKTASRSRKAPTESSSASGTGGGQTDRTSAPDEDAGSDDEERGE